MTTETPLELQAEAIARELYERSEGGMLSAGLVIDNLEILLEPRGQGLILTMEELGRVLVRARLKGTEIDLGAMLAHHLVEGLRKR